MSGCASSWWLTWSERRIEVEKVEQGQTEWAGQVQELKRKFMTKLVELGKADRVGWDKGRLSWDDKGSVCSVDYRIGRGGQVIQVLTCG